METAAELNTLKEEVETLNIKLAALSDEELTQLSGGVDFNITDWNGYSSQL